LTATRRLAAGVIANSHAGGRFAQRLLRLRADRVHVVWNGIEPASDDRGNDGCLDIRRDFFTASAGIKVASVVSMFRPQKDHELALRVAQALVAREPSWRMLFVGDSLPHTEEYRRRVCRMREELGLIDVVRFAGLRRDVRDIVRQSNVLLSTSLHEGFPNVVLEAMSVGTPVVSTDYSDIRRILPQEWQVVGSRNAAELADAVIRADQQRGRLLELQDDWLRTNATLDRQVDRLEAVYRQYVTT
jgi:glycosyltransferase involved in cell wall biosynthesis